MNRNIQRGRRPFAALSAMLALVLALGGAPLAGPSAYGAPESAQTVEAAANQAGQAGAGAEEGAAGTIGEEAAPEEPGQAGATEASGQQGAEAETGAESGSVPSAAEAAGGADAPEAPSADAPETGEEPANDQPDAQELGLMAMANTAQATTDWYYRGNTYKAGTPNTEGLFGYSANGQPVFCLDFSKPSPGSTGIADAIKHRGDDGQFTPSATGTYGISGQSTADQVLGYILYNGYHAGHTFVGDENGATIEGDPQKARIVTQLAVWIYRGGIDANGWGTTSSGKWQRAVPIGTVEGVNYDDLVSKANSLLQAGYAHARETEPRITYWVQVYEAFDKKYQDFAVAGANQLIVRQPAELAVPFEVGKQLVDASHNAAYHNTGFNFKITFYDRPDYASYAESHLGEFHVANKTVSVSVDGRSRDVTLDADGSFTQRLNPGQTLTIPGGQLMAETSYRVEEIGYWSIPLDGSAEQYADGVPSYFQQAPQTGTLGVNSGAVAYVGYENRYTAAQADVSIDVGKFLTGVQGGLDDGYFKGADGHRFTFQLLASDGKTVVAEAQNADPEDGHQSASVSFNAAMDWDEVKQDLADDSEATLVYYIREKDLGDSDQTGVDYDGTTIKAEVTVMDDGFGKLWQDGVKYSVDGKELQEPPAFTNVWSQTLPRSGETGMAALSLAGIALVVVGIACVAWNIRSRKGDRDGANTEA